jgi:hypothetical protein
MSGLSRTDLHIPCIPPNHGRTARRIEPEWLDVLPANDPRALRSRRDLRRLNSWMGHGRIMARVLPNLLSRFISVRLVEWGAGDGEFLFRVANRLSGKWRRVEAQLVDRHDVFQKASFARFTALNWHIQPVIQDVFDWVQTATAHRSDAILANLFLHQFTDNQLTTLFREATKKTDTLVAIEPRRGRWPAFCSRLLWLAGCGTVTCHDAPISVHAGFAGTELSALWPEPKTWSLMERPIGLFSHLFVAQRNG